jgi:hypothetical protein
MPPRYGYLTRHLSHRATHTWLSGSASRQASPSTRNEEETRYYTQIPRCSGLDSHNEQTPALKVPLQTELRFHSRGYEQPPHRRACGTTSSSWLVADHCSSSDNDLRSGQLNSCSDDLRADAATTRPSESRLEGVNRANLRFTNLITTTSRVSIRNVNESKRGRENKSQANEG